MLARLARVVDGSLLRAATNHEGPATKTILPLVTRAADGSKLWLGVAGALALSGSAGRRSAAKGLVGIGVSSALVNGPLKQLTNRRRPGRAFANLTRKGRKGRAPRTSSFPSGHAASAMAFTVAAGGDDPRLLAALLPLAGLVGWSRLASGRHFPSDVVAGATLGAVAGLATRRTWTYVEQRQRDGDGSEPPSMIVP